MAFAILRVEKMNNMGSIGGKDSHELRQRETLNADPERESLNRQIIGTVAVDDVKERLASTGVAIRKDSVLAIDVFATASPEHFGRNHPDDPACRAFQFNLVKFLHQEFGEDNVVSLRAHHDETSPHWHATVVPIREKTIKVGRQVKTERTENRLCAKDWLGGDRHTLSKLQTRFADSMKHLGLQRGIQGSQAKHIEVKQFYTLAQEAANRIENIEQHFPRINPDRYIEKTEKPDWHDRLKPEEYAKESVKKAVDALSLDIEKVNQNVSQAKQNELIKTAVPAINALAEKSGARQSQAERALLSLGYRLDQHGGLINIQEERKEAIKSTVLHVLSKSTSIEVFQEELLKKSIRLELSKEEWEDPEKKTVKMLFYKYGKSNHLSANDLGSEFMLSGLIRAIRKNAQVEQDREAIAKTKVSYDTTMAKKFAEFKGSATEFSKYLKRLQPDDIEEISKKIGRDQGIIGVEYVRSRLQADIGKTELQLAGERDRLRREGYDAGKYQNKGFKL
ncbi:MobV family relaxase [Arcticibacter sp.]|uniref:MobV family relaxase n=1 Tax=Arcticibacter sp. TaxID=1872630 RepID=UPI0038906E14